MIKILVSIFAGLFYPNTAYAHEVYVLDHDEVAHDIDLPSVHFGAVIQSHLAYFIECALAGIIIVAFVLWISKRPAVSKFLDPIFLKIKPYAGHIAQATLGFALLASAYYGDLFGVELPVTLVFGHYAQLMHTLLYVASISLIFGIFPRIGALIALFIFAVAYRDYGEYMINYFTYLGEALVLAIGGGSYALRRFRSSAPRLFSVQSLALRRFRRSAFLRSFSKQNAAPQEKGALTTSFHKYKFFIMRIFFATSLIYAAFYAKYIHNALALDTVLKYHLTNYFPFDPLFVVLGAFIVEMCIAIFYLIGFEIRFISIFFLTFLTMSLVFFGEAVWPHIILIGTALAMFAHGYDEYSLGKYL
jgi:hypothetical protein